MLALSDRHGRKAAMDMSRVRQTPSPRSAQERKLAEETVNPT